VRLIDLGIEPFLLSSSLALVAAQRLVRKLCPNCKKPYQPDIKDVDMCIKGSQLNPPPDPSKVVFYEPKGCDKCARTGYAGRIAIYEVYLVNQEMREVIYKYGGDLARLHEAAARGGMWGLRASGWRKVMAGITSISEILSITIEG
jgi:type II secretory ATPase GspE/PulE/Tfp pilus assembly ATPase PilB-like protein